MGVYVTLGAVAGSILVYSVSRPGANGEPSSITKLYERFAYLKEQDEIRNTLRTAAIEQAAHDKHLLNYNDRNAHIDLKFPEYVSPWPPALVLVEATSTRMQRLYIEHVLMMSQGIHNGLAVQCPRRSQREPRPRCLPLQGEAR